MSDNVLGLGPVIFRDFELPAGISFGGSQQLAVHELADGRRIIDCMGRRDADIGFSGILSGSDAAFRARQLDRLRVFAMPLPLSWDVFCFTVVVRELHLHYQSDRWIPYRIRCAVQQDETSLSVPGLAAELASPWADINAAITDTSMVGLSLGIPTDLHVGTLTFGTQSYYQACSNLTEADAALRAGVAEQELRVSQANIAFQSPVDALEALSDGTAAMRRLGILVRARGYIGRAAASLTSENPGI